MPEKLALPWIMSFPNSQTWKKQRQNGQQARQKISEVCKSPENTGIDRLFNPVYARPVNGYHVGSVKQNVAPCPGSDSIQIRPPWRSTIFLQIAKPMPVPAYCFWVCSRRNIWKI